MSNYDALLKPLWSNGKEVEYWHNKFKTDVPATLLPTKPFNRCSKHGPDVCCPSLNEKFHLQQYAKIQQQLNSVLKHQHAIAKSYGKGESKCSAGSVRFKLGIQKKKKRREYPSWKRRTHSPWNLRRS
jgi:hypothetical protein